MSTLLAPRPLLPRQPVPPLQVPTLDHGLFDLAADAPQHFTLLVFYRGLVAAAQRGVQVIALSTDTAERARAMADKLKAPGLRMGHSLPLAQARDWGLYLSTSRGTTSIGIEEPALFAEPGVFIVRPDGTLYYGAVQTMPFARPHFDELLAAIDFALAKDYPARGEYAGAV